MRRENPTIRIIFNIGSGHFEHVLSLILSYFTSPSVIHSLHTSPLYPSAQFIGNSFVSLNPPNQASSFGHSIISVLFKSLRQYPLFRLIILPSQDALSGQI